MKQCMLANASHAHTRACNALVVHHATHATLQTHMPACVNDMNIWSRSSSTPGASARACNCYPMLCCANPHHVLIPLVAAFLGSPPCCAPLSVPPVPLPLPSPCASSSSCACALSLSLYIYIPLVFSCILPFSVWAAPNLAARCPSWRPITCLVLLAMYHHC